jgi:hypothetical protein
MVWRWRLVQRRRWGVVAKRLRKLASHAVAGQKRIDLCCPERTLETSAIPVSLQDKSFSSPYPATLWLANFHVSLRDGAKVYTKQVAGSKRGVQTPKMKNWAGCCSQILSKKRVDRGGIKNYKLKMKKAGTQQANEEGRMQNAEKRPSVFVRLRRDERFRETSNFKLQSPKFESKVRFFGGFGRGFGGIWRTFGVCKWLISRLLPLIPG